MGRVPLMKKMSRWRGIRWSICFKVAIPPDDNEERIEFLNIIDTQIKKV